MAGFANAQVNTYTFSQANGTYTDIGATADTVAYATGTGTSAVNSLDDVIYPAIPIPFTFTIDGNSYSSYSISSNGFITFGGTDPAGGYYTPISGTTAYERAASGYGRDNIGTRGITATRTASSNVLTAVPSAHFVGLEVGRIITGTGIPASTTITALNQGAGTITISNNATASGTTALLVATGSIMKNTTGSVGSRVHTIQFKGFRPFTSTANANHLEFQIRLYEGTNVIDVTYGNNTNSASTTGQVGLRGSANTDFNNRSTTTNWAATTAGGTNAVTCTMNGTVVPASGLRFIWTPPVPPVADDMGVSAASIGAPGQIISAGKGYNLNATARNFGTAVQNVVPVYYTVNGGSPVGPVNTVGPIPSGGSENVVFSGGNAFTAVTPGVYVIKVYTALSGDGNAVNDTLTLNLTVNAKVTVPYLEVFTAPVNWTVLLENVAGTAPIYALTTCVNPDGVAADIAVRANFFSASAGRREVLRSPEFDLTGVSNPVLNFYVAYRTFTGNEQDSLEVLVSTDGGLTFFSGATVYNKAKDTNPSLATLPNINTSYVPANQIEWRHETVSLANVANSSNVVIGFRGKSRFGNNAWIDNVSVTNADGFCTSSVTGIGSYSCAPDVSLSFTALPLPPQNGNTPDNIASVKSIDVKSGNDAVQFESANGEVKVLSGLQTDNPLGGTAFVSTYMNNNPGGTVITNSTATAPNGLIFTPSNVYHDKWYRITYDGNDWTGYSTYNISIDLGSLVFADPDALYIVKRTDQTGNWTCLTTTRVGTVLTASGLGDFSDFGIGGDEALPVELSSFVSVISGNNVTLNWSTSTETNNAGFDIERSAVNGSWSKIGYVAGNGTSTVPHSYSYTDRSVASGTYSYRLKQVDFNGNFTYYNLGNEVIIGVPEKFDLSQNYPNPFNPSTKINYALPVDGKVSIKLFDMSGKEVASLVNEVKTAGYHTVDFNASTLSSGVYFYRINVEGSKNFVDTKKMMLVK